MKKIIPFAIALLIVTSCTAQKEITIEEQWINLIDNNPKDWFPKIRGQILNSNYNNTFIIQDSVLQVNYSEYDSFNAQFGHIFYKEPFSYYKLKYEYRFFGDQMHDGPGWAFKNSGIMIHSQVPGTMGIDQDFPISIEVQLLGGGKKGKRPTANLCTPGTNVHIGGKLFTQHCVNSTSETFRTDEWVNGEIEVYGDSLIRHYINGEIVLEYTRPELGGGNVDGASMALFRDGTPLSGGYISLQSESHPVEFKNVLLLNLEGCMDPDAENFMPWAIKSDSTQCVFNED